MVAMSKIDTGPILHSTNLDSIALRLRITREAFGLSQVDLCGMINVATNTYNQWERGKSRPQLDHAFLLCEGIGVTLDWIYRGEINGLSFDIISKIKPFLPKS